MCYLSACCLLFNGIVKIYLSSYANLVTKTCDFCNVACTSCISSISSSSTCFGVCATGFYGINPCSSCFLGCSSCTGGLPTNCNTCSYGYFLYSGKCLTSCPAGWYSQ